MENQGNINNFVFESREDYENAKEEWQFIQKTAGNIDLTQPKNALKVYNKFVADKRFSTIVGYSFLHELRLFIMESGMVSAENLAEIPVKQMAEKRNDIIPERPSQEGKFRRLYEGQQLINKKLKIALLAAVIVLIGFVVINFKFEYTIFTYFTDYKANMEEELIDKYEHWESELEEREKKLAQ